MKIEKFVEADLSQVDNLQPADWGNVRMHYEYYISHDNCIPLKLHENGSIKGIGAVIHHQDTAWLAHIIVDESLRNKGYGAMITQTLIDSIDDEHFRTVYLMATELGYHVYKKLGFIEEGKQNFYKTEKVLNSAVRNPNIVEITKENLPDLLELDAFVSGEKRTYRILEDLVGAMGYFENGKLLGSYLPDLLEGPVYAINVEAGLALMEERLKIAKMAVVPESNIIANEFYKQRGFELYRTARRMRLGKERPWHPEFMYNRFSGQIG